MKKVNRKICFGMITLFIALGITSCGSDSYVITKNDSEHGSYVTEIKNSEVTSAKEGDVVSVVVAPDDGFIFNSVSIKNGGKELTTFKSGKDQYSFTMPAAEVSVSVVFGYKPNTYTPDASVMQQPEFSSASLLTYADNTFEYTYVTVGQGYGATQTTTAVYVGTWEMDGNDIVLTATAVNYTYSFTHPKTEVAKEAYNQFCEEFSTSITDRLDAANTAYVNDTNSNDVLTFTLNDSSMSFGIATT